MLLPGARSPVNRSEKAGAFLLPVVRMDERFRLPWGAIDRLIIGNVPGYVDQSTSAAAWYRLTHSDIPVAIPWNSMRYSSMVIGTTRHERGSSPWSSHRARGSIPGRSLGRDPPQGD
jgi:hypothetical protein